MTSVITDWRRTDQCAAPTTTTSDTVSVSAATCAQGRAVELISIADAGHGWPGSPPKASNSTLGGDTPSQAIDATSAIWQFFAAHPKP